MSLRDWIALEDPPLLDDLLVQRGSGGVHSKPPLERPEDDDVRLLDQTQSAEAE
jgi:hypothetical protein